jgi:hypothetical protein
MGSLNLEPRGGEVAGTGSDTQGHGGGRESHSAMETGDGTEPRRTRRDRSPGNDEVTRNCPVQRKQIPAVELAAMAREQFEEITGQEVEAISTLMKRDQGWELHVEVLELERIPQTTSVLASYAIFLDSAGRFLGYDRLRRYTRGEVDV